MQKTDRIVGVPVTTQCRVPTIQTAQGTVEVPQVQFLDRMDGVPVVIIRQAPQETIEETIEVPKSVSQGRIPQRTAEQITDFPVSQVVEELIEVSNGRVVDIPVLQVAEEFIEILNVFTRSRVQQRIVEPITETPAVSLAEEIVEAPKAQTQEERIHERTVEESDVHVPHVTEKITKVVKHIPQERMPNRAMEHIIDAPVPQIQETVGSPNPRIQEQTVEAVKAPEVQVAQRTIRNLQGHWQHHSERERFEDSLRFNAKHTHR